MKITIDDKIRVLSWFKDVNQITPEQIFKDYCQSDHNIHGDIVNVLVVLSREGNIDQETDVRKEMIAWKANRHTIDYLNELQSNQEITRIERDLKLKSLEKMNLDIPKTKWEFDRRHIYLAFAALSALFLVLNYMYQTKKDKLNERNSIPSPILRAR